MFGKHGSPALAKKVQKFLVEGFLYDLHHSVVPVYSDFTIPEEITAQVVTAVIMQLVLWWLETPNTFTAEQMAAMTYQSLHHKQPPQAN